MKTLATALKPIRVNSFRFKLSAIALLAISFMILGTSPAFAHHMIGGVVPQNAWEGFLSGLAHPVIGLDHLAFVVASGLLSALVGGGWLIPVAFVGLSLIGTAVHVAGWFLPLPEIVIASSVLLFGGVLALQSRPHSLGLLIAGAIAGLFHGYAYGESIVGAEMTPLVAYLVGFALVQMAIAVTAYAIAQRLGGTTDAPVPLNLRFAGFLVLGIGTAFLSGAILG